MNIFNRVLRSGEGRKLRALEALVPDINALEPEFEALSDAALQAKTNEFRTMLDNGAEPDDLLMESFATVREAAKRVLGQRHYDVQLVGGAALHLGWVAEMKTGEGKTLTSTLPIYLTGVTGKGVHVVTVNDYLASRDAAWMGQVYRWMGLSVGLILPGERDPAAKRAQYAADITHGTNNEFGFDYLRDNMAMSREAQVQRGHHYCIVDEIDSILIDEARTPLIISGRVADAAKLYTKFASIARGLQRDLHYEVDEEKRTVAPLEDGIHAVERALGIENLYDQVSANLVHQLQAALRAKELYLRDKEYIIADGEVKIVDEFTGRVLDGRRWSDGLHQAVEAKEGVAIKEENQTLATITLQNYYRLYERLAGMTGTAETEASEFVGTYGLHVVPVPTNRPLVRKDEGDLIYKTEHAKFRAVLDDIETRYETGQPVLVGTISVEKSEMLALMMERRGIPHEVLNAKQHLREAEIVVQAGRLNKITVATNMAGRGVDILLGGNPEGLAKRDLAAEGLDPESEEGKHRFDVLLAKHTKVTNAEKQKVIDLGGLYVLGTERHESRRIDNQLRGRAGRQGDPGESRFYLSLEDELMRLFATGAMSWVMDRALDEDVPIEAKMVSKAIERAQNTVEQRNAETRKNVLEYDEVMNEQRKVIYLRRSQILDGTDLKSEVLEYIDDAVTNVASIYASTEAFEDWDLDGMITEVTTLWPTELTADDLREVSDTEALEDLLYEDGAVMYQAREAELGEEILRQVERQVMLRLIDQRWREHLREMDLLREGIHLRAMGQKDPVTEWQREGFEMFGMMMSGIALDFIKYIMHVQVAVNQTPEPAQEQQLTGVTEKKSDAASGIPSKAIPDAGAPKPVEANAPKSRVPIVKSDLEKVGRNDPCPCGNGKKYKHCHGATGTAG